MERALLIIPRQIRLDRIVLYLSAVLGFWATIYAFAHGYIVAYGDAESHLNIAKRVVDSLTPGFAQLGGIWLPLPHIFLIPFVKNDFLWRTGLAGSIVSGLAYVVSSVFIYKLGNLIIKNRWAALVASFVFMFNPNILYLQTTPMTEMPLIVFFILSSYWFVKFLQNEKDLISLILAAFFGLCASLSRYDGWFLVGVEALVLGLQYIPWKKIPSTFSQIRTGFDRKKWDRLEGRVILFCSLAFLGIVIWLSWDALILGDPLYFTHSQFSASSQQQSWMARGELPSYRHFFSSISYYSLTSAENIGLIASCLAVIGLIYWLSSRQKHSFFILLILAVPYIFYVATLYMGQSVIFIPGLTPSSFEWNLFNVRYGAMMVPFAALLIGFLFFKVPSWAKVVVLALVIFQIGLFATGRAEAITLRDGTSGLSSQIAKLPDAQNWIDKNYDGGLVLTDDFARTISIVRTSIPMQKIIYVGNKPYWEESLKEPEKYATWIIMQKDDSVWTSIYDKPDVQGRLFKYFVKAYTSPEILIFKRNFQVPAG